MQFLERVYRTEINIGTYTSNGITVLTIKVLNLQEYPIGNPALSVHFDNANTSYAACTPTSVAPGNYMICSVDLSSIDSLNQFVSGGLYLSARNCGLNPDYLSTKICGNAPFETFTGGFTGHTTQPVPAASLAITASGAVLQNIR